MIRCARFALLRAPLVIIHVPLLDYKYTVIYSFVLPLIQILIAQ